MQIEVVFVENKFSVINVTFVGCLLKIPLDCVASKLLGRVCKCVNFLEVVEKLEKNVEPCNKLFTKLEVDFAKVFVKTVNIGLNKLKEVFEMEDEKPFVEFVTTSFATSVIKLFSVVKLLVKTSLVSQELCCFVCIELNSNKEDSENVVSKNKKTLH